MGRRSILIRAIGFLPYSRAVTVETRGTSLGVVALHAAATILPELEVTGASMSDDGVFLVPFQPSRAQDPPVVSSRVRPLGLSEIGDFGYGDLLCNRTSKPVATRIDDGATGRVLYSDGTVWTKYVRRPVGDCVRDWPIKFGGVAIGAAASPRGWVVATEDSAGSMHLRGFGDLSRPLWSIPLRTLLGATIEVKKVMLAPAGGGVTVSLTESPFSWALVDSAGSIRFQSSPFSGRLADTLLDRVGLERWKGYAVLPVRNGFIQTLESPRVQQGLFVLYDIAGRPVKVMRRHGASVLVASAPEMRMLLGYRYNSPRRGSFSRLFMYRY